MSTFSIFLILIIFIAFLLVVVIMVQNPKGGGLSSSFGGGGTQQLGGVKKTRTDTLAAASIATSDESGTSASSRENNFSGNACDSASPSTPRAAQRLRLTRCHSFIDKDIIRISRLFSARNGAPWVRGSQCMTIVTVPKNRKNHV